LRVELVKVRPEKYQSKEGPFGSTTRTITAKVGDSTKKLRRSHFKEWFESTKKVTQIMYTEQVNVIVV